MKKSIYVLLALLCAIALSCHQEEEQDVTKIETVSDDIISKLQRAGFDTSEGLTKYRNGYLVEYDILLTEEQIDELIDTNKNPKNGRVQHYRTFNLVSASPSRTLNIFMDTGFDTYMQTAFDQALSNYNAVNLSLRFQRVSSSASADISIFSFYEVSNVLGYSAGFPSGGNAASPIYLNTYYYNSSTSRPDASTVIAHEIGHAIGFRHTDYMNRAFSCGGSGGNEGDAGVGAVNIPGTPTTPSAGSWMLACSNNTYRPFTPDDITALKTVYPHAAVSNRTIQSVSFGGRYLRMDGSGVTTTTDNGGGVVNVQNGASIYEQFKFYQQPDGSYAIESAQFPNVYLRMHAPTLTAPLDNGGGVANAQYGSYAQEKFYVVKQSDGSYTINSVAFSNIFLRMDASAVTAPLDNGGGIVNCQYGASTYERFYITPDL